MYTNDLCTKEENEQGFSAHYSSFSIVILKNNNWFMEVSGEEELHEILHEQIEIN